MADQSFELDVFRDLLEEAQLVGQLGKTQKTFISAYEAFRVGDRKGFQAVLKRLGLLTRCHLVCEWIRIKECVFVCLQLCGPPKPVTRAPDPRLLAEAIVRITSNEKALRQLVQAIEKPDKAAYQRLVKQYKLEPICHFFCHWVCYVRYQLMCRWVCDPVIVERPDLAAELQAAGNAMRAMLERKQVFDALASASLDGDAAKLGSIVQDAELAIFCRWICSFWCSWRCVLVCLTICREFPLPAIENPLTEAYAFAVEVGKLAGEPAQLEALSAAVGAGDAKAFAAQIDQLKLQRYCVQLCHWLCFVRCRRFCFLWCPPIYNHPWFTHVGDFNIDTDIDPGTGLTNKAVIGHGGTAHGGPGYGFFGNLVLRGFCPKTHPTTGEPMAYRFRYDQGGGPKPMTGVGVVSDVRVGYRYILWMGFLRKQDLWVSANPPPPPPPGPFPPPHYLVPDPQGWVYVDPDAQDDGFDGDLMGFRSDVVFPGGDATPAGLTAGSAVSAGQRKNGIDTAIHFQATRVGTIGAVNGGASPDFHNDLSKIHIDNWNEVSLLELQEFINPGATPCTPLTNDLHVLYTTDHELMADWFIDMVTSATVVPAPTFPSGAGPRGGAGSDFHDISTWPNCSYLIRLHTRRSLTDGLDDDTDKWIFRTFCVGRRNGR